MNTLHTPLGLVAVLLAVSASAQNVAIFPSDHANREGVTSQSTFPFSAGISRAQAIYHRRDLTLPAGATITAAGVRQDAASSSTGVRVQLEVAMGQTDLDPRSGAANPITATFANNYVGSPTTVFTRKVVDLPNLIAGTQRPSPTNVTVTFDVPFRYDATKNLVADWLVHANANGNQGFAYTMDYAYSGSLVDEFGLACSTSGNLTPRCRFNETDIGGTCTVSLSSSSASSPATLFLGAAAQSAPVPLAGLGMPGCFLHVVPMVSVATATNTGGGSSTSFPVPNALNLIRRSLVAQYVTADVFANAAGLVSSNGSKVTLGVAPMLSVVSAVGSTTAATGSVYGNWGGVSVFVWQ